MTTSAETWDHIRNNRSSVVGLCLLVLLGNVALYQSFYHTPKTSTSRVLPSPITESSLVGPGSKTWHPWYEKNRPANRTKLDFMVAAFPKCGTTTLIDTFHNHSETDMSIHEQCGIGGASHTDGVALHNLTTILNHLSPGKNIKRGIKCPDTLRSARFLSRLAQYAPDLKMIVGVRHPVKWIQSYYNFRVTEHYGNKDREEETIPPLETLKDGNDWREVSKESGRFELLLMQLGKTSMDPEDFQKLRLTPTMGVVPNSFKVFIYSLEQMKDSDEARNEQFREDFSSFLDLQNPLIPFTHANINYEVGAHGHNETINICNAKYDKFRAEMVSQSAETVSWIRDKFLKSPEVFVSNKNHFLETLEGWKLDPCASSEIS